MVEQIKLKSMFFDDFNNNSDSFWDSTLAANDLRKVIFKSLHYQG
jgi:hypothetical protein